MPPASNPDCDNHLLRGASILVMEDNFLQAADLVAYLEEVGVSVVGPFASLNEGWIGICSAKRLDAAVLDVVLKDEELVYPILIALRDAGIPVLLVSGLDRGSLPSRFEDLPLVVKPCSPQTVGRQLSALFQSIDRGSARS